MMASNFLWMVYFYYNLKLNFICLFYFVFVDICNDFVVVRYFGVLDEFSLWKTMDQKICIKFDLKNGIKCNTAFKMLIVSFVTYGQKPPKASADDGGGIIPCEDNHFIKKNLLLYSRCFF